MNVSLQKTLDLRKQMVLDLKKKSGMESQKAQVMFALDYSGSMGSLYTSGAVQQLVERILPLGLGFDDNGEVDFYLFHDGFKRMPENITLNNVEGYINKKVLGKYDMGGTNYAPVINQIVHDAGGNVVPFQPRQEEKKGFFGKMFGGKKEAAASLEKSKKFDLPVYVIFITDGENFDKEEAEHAIINASNYGIFFQFIGIGNASFRFLKELDVMSGRVIDNANFFQVPDLTRKTDEDLYKLLLQEFPLFVKEAKTINLIA
jgi:hypothetical protein